jgi:carboxylesterase
MKLFRIPETTQILPPCNPIYYEGKQDKPAVLLIHGFTGGPHDLAFFAERISEHGYSVSVPRLPGHGTNGEDFVQSNAEQWLRASIDAYLDLRSKYERVWVGGLSMGGVLSIILASRFPIDRLMLFAPAVIVNNPLISLSKLIGRMLPRTKHIPLIDENASPEIQEIQRRYGSYTWIRQAGELHRLQRIAKRYLPRVHAQTFMILSENDITVPLASGRLIEKRINSKDIIHRIYSKSGHVITNGSERERAVSETLEWLNKTV